MQIGADDESSDVFLYDGEEDVPQDVTHVKVDASLQIIFAQTFFVHSHLQSCALPDGLRIIRSRAFFMCEALSFVRFPSSLQEIETCAFVGCAKLSQALLPQGIKVLGSAAFAKCESLTHFQVPPLIQVIDVSLFSNCKNLYSIELPPTGIWRIGSRAFKNCRQLRNIVLPESITAVEGFAFSGCTCLLEALSISNDDVDDDDRNLRICQALKNRFDLLPLHKLCYYQGYDCSMIDDDSNSTFSLESVQQLKHLLEQGGLGGLYQCEAISGITPLHVLALSCRPTLELAQAVVDFWRTSQDSTLNQHEHQATCNASSLAQAKDRWNRDPLMYASMNLTTESTTVTKFLLETLLSPLLNSLGLTRWRLEVMGEMDKLHHSNTRSERVQHMEKVWVKLNIFVHLERLSVLELAIWKAYINSNRMKAADNDKRHDNDQGRDTNTEQLQHLDMDLTSRRTGGISYQEDRSQSRTLCGAQIIVSHVLLLLGDP